MVDLRCKSCNKLLFKYHLRGFAIIQVKCLKCSTLNEISIKLESPLKKCLTIHSMN